jgi:hypothetical protein
VVLIEAMLAPGQRTVAAILRVIERSDDRHVQHSHRVLTRAHWSSRERSRLLLLLVADGSSRRPRLVVQGRTIQSGSSSNVTSR